MPVPRDPTKPQHNISDMHWGSLLKNHLPAGEQPGDMFYWDHLIQEWVFVRLEAGPGLTVNFDSDNGTLTLSLSSELNLFSFIASAIVLKAATSSFSADAELVV